MIAFSKMQRISEETIISVLLYLIYQFVCNWVGVVVRIYCSGSYSLQETCCAFILNNSNYFTFLKNFTSLKYINYNNARCPERKLCSLMYVLTMFFTLPNSGVYQNRVLFTNGPLRFIYFGGSNGHFKYFFSSLQ